MAELSCAGFPIPSGFVVSTHAYRAFVKANGLQPHILELAQQAQLEQPQSLEEASTRIHALFESGNMPAHIADAIGAQVNALTRNTTMPLAVRSSATAEDLPGMSFAGQQDTFLNVIGVHQVLQAVKQCWASLWTARAISYRARNRIPPDQVALAVVVQQMIPSQSSGVLFTANPLTGNRDEIVIDASFGLGEAIVAGKVEPDHFVVDARTGQIKLRKLGAKGVGGGAACRWRHR
ncbi:MAG: hypothetical protein HC853_17265 [Anaerolineae bacterium]|nr:hypothetical protein [Anaerolineae bacterium]